MGRNTCLDHEMQCNAAGGRGREREAEEGMAYGRASASVNMGLTAGERKPKGRWARFKGIDQLGSEKKGLEFHTRHISRNKESIF